MGAVCANPVRQENRHERRSAGIHQVQSDEIRAGKCVPVRGTKPACRRPTHQPRGRCLCHRSGNSVFAGGSAGVDPAAHGKRHGGTDPHL